MIEPGKIVHATLSPIVGVVVTPRVDVNEVPFVRYDIQSTAPTRVKERILFRNYSASMTAYAATYSQTMNLADEVISRMEAIAGTTVMGAVVRRVNTQFTGDIFEEEIGFGVDLTINLTINED